MRAFWEAIEKGWPGMSKADLDASFSADDLSRLRGAGLLRDEGRTGFEEISLADLGRALRTIYGAQGRGLTLPAMFDSQPQALGWAPHGDGEREISLWIGPKIPWFLLPHVGRPCLVLLPTGRHVTPAMREQYGAEAQTEIEILDETIRWEGARLARGSVSAPPPADLSSPRLPAVDPSRRIPGAPRWNAVHIARVDDETVHVSFPGVALRRTHVDLGMADARHGRPRRIFELLLALCEGHGVFLSTRFGSAAATKKLVSRLGDELCGIFGLRESPFHPYRRKEGWQAKFIASPGLQRSV